MITVGSDFSGVGAFNQALIRLGIPYKELFACDMDKYARQTFIHNYGEPDYYPENVYDREIPKESLSIYMTSPPCQSFSLAGKRKGKEDLRGVLFFNSHEFIQVNKPRFFIFENVKGLLSDDNGNTFQEWINYLGGKSVNGLPVIFPTDEAVPYHIYWKVLNAKKLGVPQNRERVFIIGIRDDEDNVFNWPNEVHLTKKLKDVLEPEVDEKYFLSKKMMDYLVNRSDNFNAGKINYKTENDSASCLTKSSSSIDISDNIICIGNTHPSGNGMNGNVFHENGISPTLSTNKGEGIKIGTWRTHEDGKGFRETEDNNCPTIPARAREDGSGQPVIMIPSATSKGFELATENDSINFSVPNSKTRRGRVGKEVAQTLDTACNQGVIQVVAFGRSESEKQRRKEHFRATGEDSGSFKDKELILKNQTYYDTFLAHPNPQKEGLIASNFKIRRLTPRECFRLMDFPDTFTWTVSDSQAYKQAGNSIVVKCLELIIKGLKKL
jgi:DNA (cytosine-5)-methyltransferase 1